jgi:putative ABC transport system ATP-binding protein
MSAQFAVVAHRISKCHGTGSTQVSALRQVDLAVARGEFVAVTGPSGCGKSTLLQLIAGLDTPTFGTVLVNGTDIGRMEEDDRTAYRGQHIGVVFQAFNLLDMLTAEENVALPLILAGIRVFSATRRASEALARVGLAGRANSLPAELSGGEQQRVAVARALVIEPQLLLADEPTGNLDTTNSRQVFDLLHEVARESQRTVVMVTHDPVLARLADRIVRLRDGTIQ